MFIFRFSGKGGAVGAPTNHIADILGRGEKDVPAKFRVCLGFHFGAMKLKGMSLVHAGVELSPEGDFSVKSTRGKFTKHLQPLPAPPGLWAARK